ncbi:MAG: EamA family transporter [Pyrinomonadaceae bacterium]
MPGIGGDGHLPRMPYNFIKSLTPLLTVSLGIALYQVCLKRIPALDYPFRLLTIVYVLSAVITLVLSHFFPSNADSLQIVKEGGVGIALLSAAPVIIEIGYLAAFRSGWKLGTLNVAVCAACVLLMLAIGYVLFRERISASQFAGVVLCMSGVFLATKP